MVTGAMTGAIVHKVRPVLPALLAISVMLAACGDSGNEYKPPPPPPVTVVHPTVKQVTNYLELTGSAASIASVDLVARVPGYLQSINFQDGSIVKKGAPLFVIEPAPYEANVKLAQATLEQQKAELTRASEEYDRQLRLVKQKASSQADVEKWLANRNSAKAAVDEAQANLEIAQINLSYTKVTAPFDGRIGRHLVDTGNLVGTPTPTKLATIEQVAPIYVYFAIDEPNVLRIRAMMRQRGIGPGEIQNVTVDIGLQDDDGYPHQGKLDFVDTGIDPSTGTLQARAVVPNADFLVLPGMFVRVRLPISKDDKAMLVSDRALGADQAGRYVLVVNDKDIVEQRTVQGGALVDGMRVITSGLKESDWVVVEGLQRATPGTKVTVTRGKGTASGPASQSEADAKPKDSGGAAQ